MKRKLLLITAALCMTALSSNAQVEGAYLYTKNFQALGFGGFLNFKFPFTEAANLTTEVGLYNFQKDGNSLAMIPLMLGYQYTFDGSGTGLFAEPILGYTFGDSNVPQYDDIGEIPDPNNPGYSLKQMAKGPTAAFATGYIFPGRTPVSIALKYQRVFVSSGPGVNVATLRFSYPLFGGRRNDY